MSTTTVDRGVSAELQTADRQPEFAYRKRVYDHYVSAFKGRPSPDALQEEYERRAQVFDHILAPLLRVCRTGSVLEVACGQGAFLYWALRQGFKSVQGFDLSEEQVAVAQEMGLPAEVASFTDHLTRYQGGCDLVAGFDVIEHLNRDEAFQLLELCFAALQPGGSLFLTTPNGAALRPGTVQYGDLTHETIFSPESITTALTLTGFEEVAVNEITPPATSLRSRARSCLWQLIRLGPRIVDLVETGMAPKVLTRVMAVQARRPG